MLGIATSQLLLYKIAQPRSDIHIFTVQKLMPTIMAEPCSDFKSHQLVKSGYSKHHQTVNASEHMKGSRYCNVSQWWLP